MKKNKFFFIWVLLLAIGIMVVITATQIVASRSQVALEQGNKQAVTTFNINNRLEELTSLSYALENKILSLKDKPRSKNTDGLADSLTQLGYNVSVLQKLWVQEAKSDRLNTLVKYINDQIDFSLKLSDTLSNSKIKPVKLIDSFATKHYGDSIYAHALAFQKELERSLSKNFENNNNTTQKLGLLNFLLAVITLLAVLILVSIIIKRQQKQLVLIDDLKVARRHALKSNEIKDQFLANMSHEIRTPLNALQGFSKLILETNLTTDQAKYSHIIASASNNLLNIVNDILDFSKIESNLLSIKKIPFILANEIATVQQLMQKMADDKQLQLTFDTADTDSQILYGDAGRLNQILINLIGNAIKFTSHGSIKVSVHTLEASDMKKTLQFSISDTGHGIPTDKLGTIFERFEQIDNSFSRQQGGTGLGLAIVKKLTLLMQGQISVTSQIDKGTSFILTLPFDTTISEQNPLIITDNNYIDPELLQHYTILVAEDNAMNQLLITQLLKKFNTKIIIANNGAEALQIIAQQNISLVLMDVQMPEMDGVTATKKIRATYGDSLPIVAMTAHVMENEKQKCLVAGMNDYLTKPINEVLLYNTIKRLLPNPAEHKKEVTVSKSYIGYTYISEVCNNQPEQINTILNTLIINIPKEIAAVNKIIAEKDYVELKRKIHHLKSTLSALDNDSDINVLLLQIDEHLTNSEQPTLLVDKINILIKELWICKQILEAKVTHQLIEI